MLDATISPQPSDVPHPHLSRLLQGMAEVVQQKAYAAITIADIVQMAGVSKRSFYEHFDSKEACFLALYRAASASALRTLREAVVPDQPWQSRVEQGFQAYFSHLAAGAGLLRALFIDIHYLGEPGAQARRDVMQALAAFMLDTVNDLPSDATARATLSPELAMAAVGGINEWLLMAIETDQVAKLADLTATASQLVYLLMQAPVRGSAGAEP
ncbi:hypothetical protein LPB72_07460 [Hydrogenophaga crassostreae]|uniref:HTH tetR-type domain-containing protein n=1 Tax=Hydrogenophaga crassostreae TaxID=1763535 RepID=A0A162P9N2_9BURK|nr:TetR/AcrR family transcriptional regulator [Hydrogenophaga crassostreae]AOW13119.1 hypothetical protein LPB072_09910 [Hydrogenophaga crassostreae]OAD42736.1 hypothetical protein LPB72_07460 [Hydrogenophaga crassostreae]